MAGLDEEVREARRREIDSAIENYRNKVAEIDRIRGKLNDEELSSWKELRQVLDRDVKPQILYMEI